MVVVVGAVATVVVAVVVQVINQLPNISSRAVTEKSAKQAVSLSCMK